MENENIIDIQTNSYGSNLPSTGSESNATAGTEEEFFSEVTEETIQLWEVNSY